MWNLGVMSGADGKTLRSYKSNNGTYRTYDSIEGFMKDGCLTGMLRGEDSTGLFQVAGDLSHTAVHKMPCDGYMFGMQTRVKKIFDRAYASAATVLHHRKATQGSHTYENCHPFEHENDDRYLVGVHNGSLSNDRKKEDNLIFTVDSDWALYLLMRDGIDALSQFNGAFTFVWYENDGKLRIARNGERPFAIAPVRGENRILMASEPEMLYWLAKRNGMELEDVMEPDAHNVFTFDLENGDLRDFAVDPFKKYVAPVYTKPSNVVTIYRGDTNTFLGQTGLRFDQEVDFNPIKVIEAKYNSTMFDVHGEILFDDRKGNVKVIAAHLSSMSPAWCKPIVEDLASSKPSRLVRVLARYLNTDKDGNPEISVAHAGPWNDSSPKFSSVDDDHVISEEDTLPEGDVVKFTDASGKPITRDLLDKKLSGGCAYCSSPIDQKDVVEGNFQWVNNGQDVVCIDCMALDAVAMQGGRDW